MSSFFDRENQTVVINKEPEKGSFFDRENQTVVINKEPEKGSFFDRDVINRPSGPALNNYDSPMVQDIPELSEYIGGYKNNIESNIDPELLNQWTNSEPVGIFEAARRFNKWKLIPFAGAGFELAENIEIIKLIDKVNKNEQLSEKEAETLAEFSRDMSELSIRGYSFGGQVTEAIMENFAFTAEITTAIAGTALTGGAGAPAVAGVFAKQGAKAAAKKVLSKEFATRALRQQAIMSGVGTTPGFMRNYGQRRVSQMTGLTDKGQVMFKEADEKPVTTVLKALGTAQIEIFSEQAGGWLFRPIGKWVGGRVQKVVPEKLSKTFDKLGKTKGGKIFSEIMREKDFMGFHGFLEEMGEERLADVLRVAFDLDDEQGYSIDQLGSAIFPGWDELLVEAGVIGFYGAAGAVTKRGAKLLQEKGIIPAYEEGIQELQNFSQLEQEQIIKNLEQTEIGQEKYVLDAIQNDLYEQAINAGYDEQYAKEASRINTAFFSSLQDTGIDIQELYNDINLTIQGGVSENVQAESLFQSAEFAGAQENQVDEAQKEWQEKGTESKFFKQWFGDSKVVDEQSKPLVVYHSTDETFSTFRLDKVGQKGDSGWLGKGFYFFGDRSLDGQYGKNVMEIYLNIQNPYYATYEDMQELSELNDAVASEKFRENLISEGYDGVYFDGNLNQEWVAFYPEQIKSVDNQGTFSEDTGNIYYQEAKQEHPVRRMINEKWNELDKIQRKIESWETSESIIKKEKLKELKAEYKKLEKEINKLYKKLPPGQDSYFQSIKPEWDNDASFNLQEYLQDKEVQENIKKSKLNFQKQLKNIKNNKATSDVEPIVLFKPTQMWTRTGLNASKITFSQSKIKQVIKEHNLSYADLAKIPELLADPLYIFESKTDNSAYVGVLTDTKEPFVIVLKPVGKNLKIKNIIKSAYNKDSNFINREIEDGRLLYDRNNPTKFRQHRASIAQAKTSSGYNNNITHNQANFNPKGMIRFEDGQTIIELFKTADASTLVHELGHLYLKTLSDLAEVNEKVRERIEPFNEWLGSDGTFYTEDQQEQFARGFEAFLMEGKAPTNALKQAFENFKKWLEAIYNNIQALGVELNNDARRGFDNLFKTNEAYLQEIKAEYEKLHAIYNDIENISMFEKIKFGIAERKEAFDITYDEFIIPYESIAYKISPQLFKKFTAAMHGFLQLTKKDSDTITPFLKGLRKIQAENPKDFQSIGLALKNREKLLTNEILKKYNLEKEFQTVRDLLDQLYNDARDVGIDLGYLDNYYPRALKKGKLKETGKSGVDSFVDYLYKKAAGEEIDLKNQIINPEEAGYSILIKEIAKTDVYKSWTNEQRAQFANNLIRGFGKNNILLSRPGRLKHSRIIEKLDMEMDPFYEDPIQSLLSYVSSTRKTIEDRKFFGLESQEVRKLRARIKRKRNTFAEVGDRSEAEIKGKELRRLAYELGAIQAKIRTTAEYSENYDALVSQQKRLEEQIDIIEKTSAFKVKDIVMKRLSEQIQEAKDQIAELLQDQEFELKDSIGALVNDLVDKGTIYAKDERLLREILMAKFNPGVMEDFASNVRDFGYITSMGDVTSALRQFGDLALAAYKYGFWNTLHAAVSEKIITKEDLGIDFIAEEFQTRNKMQSTLKWVFKWSGLNAIDGLGKNTIINANLEKMKKLAGKNDAALNQDLQFYFGERAEQVRQHIINGNITDDVLLLSYRALADLQPVTRDQLPVNYSKFGNLRILYQLKSYAIKVFDLARQDCLIKISDGYKLKNKDLILEGFRNLIRLAFMLVLFNVPVDMLIDLLRGKAIDLADSTIDAILIYPLVNRYSAQSYQRGGLTHVVTDFVIPSGIKNTGQIFWDAGNVLAGEKEFEDVYSLSYVPLLGKEYYGHLGGGQE